MLGEVIKILDTDAGKNDGYGRYPEVTNTDTP